MNENTKIIIAGSNGFLAKLLIDCFLSKNYTIIGLNRRKNVDRGQLRLVKWDGKNQGDWSREIDGSDVVINLVGRSVDCRYTDKNKEDILNSRLFSTEAIGEAIAKADHPPKLWINASSATIYRHETEKDMDEIEGIIGSGFSVDICTAWEQKAKLYLRSECRQVLLRTSMVLGNEGGVFPVLSRLTKWGLGGKQGNGKQFVSWIHGQDFVDAVLWIIEHPELEGAINCTAPTPMPNGDFMKILRKEIKVPFGLAAKEWMLAIGAFVLRTEEELILKSRRVVPKRLESSGFEFNYPTVQKALQSLFNA